MINFYLWSDSNTKETIQQPSNMSFQVGETTYKDKMNYILYQNSLFPFSLISYYKPSEDQNSFKEMFETSLPKKAILHFSDTISLNASTRIPKGTLGFVEQNNNFYLFNGTAWETLKAQIPAVLKAVVFFNDEINNFVLTQRKANTPLSILMFGGGGGSSSITDKAQGSGGGGGGEMTFKYFSGEEADKIKYFKAITLGKGGKGAETESASNNGGATLCTYVTENEEITLTAQGGKTSENAAGGSGGSGGGGGGSLNPLNCPFGGDSLYGGGGGSGYYTLDVDLTGRESFAGSSLSQTIKTKDNEDLILVGGGGGSGHDDNLFTGGRSYIIDKYEVTGGNCDGPGKKLSIPDSSFGFISDLNEFKELTSIKTNDYFSIGNSINFETKDPDPKARQNGGNGFGSIGGLSYGGGGGGGGGFGSNANGGSGASSGTFTDQYGGGGGGGGGFGAKGGNAYRTAGGGGGGYGPAGQGGGYDSSGTYIEPGFGAGAGGTVWNLSDNSPPSAHTGGNGICLIFYYE